MDSQRSVFTVPEELPDWFEQELADMKGEDDGEAPVEISGSFAEAIQEMLSESQESAPCSQLSNN